MSSTRAGVYIRVSSDRQASEGESLEMQQARARELCEAHGWELGELYQDVLTGKDDKRPSLARFEKDLKAGAFGVVICYRVDRLGRTRRKLHELLEWIQQHDIRLISMTQPIDTSTAIGRMMLGLMIELAVFEVEQLGERVSDTLLHIGKQGRPVTGMVPYGYRYHRKHVEIDDEGREVKVGGRLSVEPSEAEGVRLAFDTYLERGSIAAATKALNALGYRTRQGRPWDITGVRMMLLNPLYGGERAVRRYPKVGGKQRTRAKAVAEMSDWLIVSAEHEAIVPPEVTRRARERYQAERTTPARMRTGKSHWGGLVTCGICGYRLNSIDPGQGRNRYLRCKTSTANACDLRLVMIPWLDLAVIQAIARAVDSSSLIQGAPERTVKPRRASARPSPERAIAAKHREMARLEFKFDREAITGEVWWAERSRVLAEIEALRAQSPEPPAIPPMRLPATFAETWGRLQGDDAIEDRRALLSLLVKRIAIDNEAAVVELREFSGVPDLEPTLVVERLAAGKHVRARWSMGADGCLDCGTSDEAHHAKDRCKRCYERFKKARRRSL